MLNYHRLTQWKRSFNFVHVLVCINLAPQFFSDFATIVVIIIIKYIYKAQSTKGFYALYMAKHNVHNNIRLKMVLKYLPSETIKGQSRYPLSKTWHWVTWFAPIKNKRRHFLRHLVGCVYVLWSVILLCTLIIMCLFSSTLLNNWWADEAMTCLYNLLIVII